MNVLKTPGISDALRTTVYILCAIMIQSCGLFQNTSKTTNEDTATLKTNTAQTQVGSRSLEKLSDVFEISNDSSSMVYSVRIFPKGNINFSPEKGFEGTADTILINAYVKKGNQNVLKDQSVEKATINFQNTLNRQKEQKTSQKDQNVERSISWKWVIAGLLVLGLVVIWKFNLRPANRF